MRIRSFFRRVLSVHSILLFIFVCATLTVLLVTPIDVIVQTLTTSLDPAIRMFIVIAVYVVFLLWTFIIYFTRIYSIRVAMNDIPSKSIYIPNKGDYPGRIWRHIEGELERCLLNVKLQAGPLCARQIIKYDGLSPPLYIQLNNLRVQNLASQYKPEEPRISPPPHSLSHIKAPHVTTILPEGDLLPPLTKYEDIIQSLGDKFMITNRLVRKRLDAHGQEMLINFPPGPGQAPPMAKMVYTNVDIPVNCTFKEIIKYLEQVHSHDMDSLLDSGSSHLTSWDGMDRLVDLYEQLRYSGELISEPDIVEFMIEFDKLGGLVYVDPEE